MRLSTTTPISFITALLAPLALSAHLRIAIPPSPLLPNPSTLPPLHNRNAQHAVRRTPRAATRRQRLRFPERERWLLPPGYPLPQPCVCAAESGCLGRWYGFGFGYRGEGAGLGHVLGGMSGRIKGRNMPLGRGMGCGLGRLGSWPRRSIFSRGVVRGLLTEMQIVSPLSLLKNPMILIAGVSMIIVFGMPYLMDNMDPEMRAEFEERQKSTSITSGTAANPLQNFDAAAWLAGSGPKKSDAPVEKGITR
ncbi:hypothetical protein LSUB1_G004455 [Lachnellula subtilissima]|uniref:Uncharacterized protein n=1 Tax=Lachnellula subtilissima TaxID=602034 RepID=A0A8H8U600_9HELO|nr:hypothetical protein LSUB1_G004455 [Lachnellula subtilissima]